MANIPYVATNAGDTAAAPDGAIPIDLFGVESGGEAHTHAAADINSGTFADARIPALAIAKITGLEARLTAIEGRLDGLEAV